MPAMTGRAKTAAREGERAMFTIAWLLRRKPGITFEQFRDHYETSHAELGKTYLGHLLLGYRRHYNQPRVPGPDGASALDRVFAAKAWDYDVITEWDLPDEAALEQVFAILADPVIGRIFHDDEEHFLDRGSVRLIQRDLRDTGLGSQVPPVLASPGAADGKSPWD